MSLFICPNSLYNQPFGEKGVINLGKMVPIVGGVISGGVDAAATQAIAAEAKNRFYYSDGEDI